MHTFVHHRKACHADYEIRFKVIIKKYILQNGLHEAVLFWP